MAFSSSQTLRQQGSHRQPQQQQKQHQHQQHPQQQQQQQQQQAEAQEVVVPGGGGGKEAEEQLVVEVSERTFNSAVLEAPYPILLELYSPYDPKASENTQKLAQVAQNSEGAIRVRRVNVERFPELMSTIGVTMTHLPAVLTLYGGRSIEKFLGKGEPIDNATLDKLVQNLLKVAGLNTVKLILKSAEQALDSGDVDGAVNIYKEILHNKQFKSEAMALAGLATCSLHTKKLDEAKEFLDLIKAHYKDDLDNPYVKRAFSALELAEAAGTSNEGELKERLAQNPKDLEAKYKLAVIYSASNRPEQAIEEALGILKIDKQFNEQAARKLLLQVFEMLGSEHPLTVKGRRRFSSIWFL